ncbi:MAG: hypothetical protein ABIQ90_17370 [Polaromonas sp.]
MKRSTAVLCGVLLFCIGVLGVSEFQAFRTEAAENEARLQREADAASIRARAVTRNKIAMEQSFEDHAMDRFLPPLHSPPASDWRSNEKNFYAKVLSGGKFDVLVVPFQVAGWAVDRATRSIMTAELAANVAQSRKVRIPDPYLVAKALGEGQRRLKLADIYKLADAVDAKRIIWGHVGHDRKGRMAITISTQDYAGDTRNGNAWVTPIAAKKFESIAFDDEVPAIQAYESVLPEILKSVGAGITSPPLEKIDSKLELEALPPSPLNLIAPAGNPAQDAYAFLLYSALTPTSIDRTKEIFAEKAHLALSGLSSQSPDYRALRARIYKALGLRMAAIKALGEAQTTEEKELLAALNGNILEVRAMAALEKNPLKRLLQKIDENRIDTAYGTITTKKAVAEVAALKLPGTIWPFIVTRVFVEEDPWVQNENASLKMLLDYELPVKGYAVEDMARAALPLTDPDKARAMVDLSVFHHGRKFVEANAASLCCEFSPSKPGPSDYLELLQGIGHDNLMKRIDFLSQGQGLPNKAVSFANSIEAIYKGYPYYAYERSRAEAQLAGRSAGAEKEQLLNASHQNAFNAVYWEQGQSLVAARALNHFHTVGGQYYQPRDNLYYADVPYRPYYRTWADGGNLQTQVDNQLAALRGATSEIGTVSELLGQYSQAFPNQGRDTDLLKSIAGRFVGSPQLNAILGAQAIRQGDAKTAQVYFRDNIKLAPTRWSSYGDVAWLLFAAGDVNAAAKMLHSYVGFKKGSEDDRVSIANHAYSAGSYFYWAGHFDLAKPFYQLAASQRSGASAEMTSGARLKLLAGDIQGAMAGTLRNAQRYQESDAYRDYLGLLHASGHSKEAWAGFAMLVKQSHAPHIWESALVGHHISGLPEAEVVSWAQQEKFRGTTEDKIASTIHLVRFATTDRTPSSGLSQAVDALDLQRWKVPEYPMPIYEGHSVVQNAPVKQRVKSMHAYFVEAYRAIKLKDFATAKEVFSESAAFYDLADYQVNLTCYLPYYAYAAAKAGEISGIEKMVSSIKVSRQDFDYQLTMAILAGASGKNEEALKFLQRARHFRPHTEKRALLTQYTFGEISGLVAEMTGSSKIRALTLEWAQKSQKFEPWQSWAYALEARLTKNPAERKRALAMLFYLDPKSEGLSAVAQPEIDAAVKALGKSNPFLSINPEVVKKEAI